MDEKDTLYARWLSGELQPEELEELKSSGALKELEAIVKISDQADLPKYNTEGALKRLQNNLPKKTTTVRQLNRVWTIGIAAAFLLAIAFFFLLQPKGTLIEAPIASSYSHQFEDGSIVTLNAGSSIKFKEKNWGNQRVLKLEGEGYFEVEAGAPFIVDTDNGQVEVLGTKFNVRTWGTRLNVICYSGQVRVSGYGTEQVLNKGQNIILNEGQNPFQKTIKASKPPWSSGLFKFEGEPLREVFKELERQYDIKVEGNIPDRSFSGNFLKGDLEKAVQDICRPYMMMYQLSPDYKTVTIP